MHKDILNYYDIDKEVFMLELNLDILKSNLEKKEITYHKTGQYPSIVRDISFFVDNKYNHNELVEQIYSSSGKYLNKVILFDHYINDDFDDNKKSLAYSLEFKSNVKTLTDKEINNDINNIIDTLTKKYDIKLRK